ncbi:OsmC family protein [Odoribacter sp. OttesenSCG-928-A06]|nr:OsmC family protein [Odoribacter sp. OttesenSCG-928-A06]
MATAKVTYLGDLRTECEHLQSGMKITTDAPTDNQGKGEAFSPTDLCATSLAACMVTIMGIYANTMKIDIVGTDIEVTKVMGTEPRRIAEVILTFHMPDKSYSDKERKALERAALSCPVHYSLGENVKKTVSFLWKEV